MNKVFLIGRIAGELELKKSNKTSFLRTSIAVDRKTKDKETDFIYFTVFGKTAEFMKKYMHKGERIALCGHLIIDKWVDNDGKKRQNLSLIADEVEFADGKTNNNDEVEFVETTEIPF